VIVNRDHYALGINPIATGNSYVMGLEGIEVNLVSLEDERRVYVPMKKGELPLWKFEAYPGGSYALSTEVQ